MTEPSQYFKGRTVQEQMNEVIGYVDVRSAEVATDAIAADVAQVHQDMLDADADATAAAASAAAAAGTLANAVKKTGEASQSIAGDIAVAGTLSGGVVTGTVITAPAPVNNTDAANKKYVDDADATKISITAVNSYAVGLTGNQGPIAGIKTFTNPIARRTGIANPTPSFVESTCITLSKTDDTVIGMVNVAATSTANITIMRTNSPTDANKYSKLFLRVSDTGKCDLVMESNTQQGYEQHVIYSFGS